MTHIATYGKRRFIASPAFVVFLVFTILVEGVVLSALIKYRRRKTPQASVNQSLTANEVPSSFLSLPMPTNTPTVTPSQTPRPTSTPAPTLTPTPTTKPVSGRPADGYSYILVSTKQGNFYAHVISLPLTSRMWTLTGNESDCAGDCVVKPLSLYASDTSAIAGINGTYFCPPDYPECAGKKNSFDFTVLNSVTGDWLNRLHMFWNDRAVIWQDEYGYHFNKEAKKEWRIVDRYSQYQKTTTPIAGIVNAPGLVEMDSIIVNQYPLTDKQKARGIKTGIGMSLERIYLVVAPNVSMEELAYVFKSLNAVFALNLDGGGSAALWYGRYVVGPGRMLPNAIVFTPE